MKHSKTSVVATLLLSLGLAGCPSGSDGGSASTTGTAPTSTPPPPVSSNSPPKISGAPADSVLMGDTYRFTPTASDPDGDVLTFAAANTPNWLNVNAKNGKLTGDPTAADVGTYDNIKLSVSDGKLSASLPGFSINVVQNENGSITLSWVPPTQNSDGSQLNDLAAYKFYYGTRSKKYDNEIRVDNPGLSTFVIDNVSRTTYYIVATTINTAGIESPYSNEAVKQVL